jgi:putative ABC transport system permease protein
MKLLGLALRNILRNRFRTALTVLGVAVAIVAFVLLRTVLTSWTDAINYAARDRIATRHKVTFIMQLPLRYLEDIRSTPGIKGTTWMNWFGGKHPKHESEFFATIAVDPTTFLQVYDEIVVPQDQREAWLQDRRGVVVGDVLAKKFGWKLGDRVTLAGTIYPGDWEFTVRGIYTTTRRSIDRSTFWFHWNYLNESTPERGRDQVGWVVSRIDDPNRAAEIAKAVDKRFDDRDVQTLSMSERAMNTSFMGMFSTVLKALDVISVVILLIMALILGNTIAMGVRERTNEYGVLRAIGFLPRHLAFFVLGEATVTGLLGGSLGLILAYPIVERGFGRFLEENMGGFFPYFRIASDTMFLALALSIVLGAVAALIPAYRASKIDVIEALRRVG